MGDCQNYGPFLGPLNIRGRIIIGTQKLTTIFTIPHMCPQFFVVQTSTSFEVARVACIDATHAATIEDAAPSSVLGDHGNNNQQDKVRALVLIEFGCCFP